MIIEKYQNKSNQLQGFANFLKVNFRIGVLSLPYAAN